MLSRTYIAPQYIDAGQFRHNWELVEDLTVQRLARVMELKTTIAFLGSGCSRALEYSSWDELLIVSSDDKLPDEDAKKLKALRKEAISFVGAPAVFQLFDEDELLYHNVVKQLRIEEAVAVRDSDANPYRALLDSNIRRFITTNYDTEMEKALMHRRQTAWSEKEKSFEQSNSKASALFSLARGPKNEYMVFHCHGKLPPVHSADRNVCLVLTENDYKRWYLSEHGAIFRDALEVTLQSNPLLVLGYSFNDPDLTRIFRDLSTQRDRSAEIFVVLDVTGAALKSRSTILLAEQALLGAGVIALDRRPTDKVDACPLASRLRELNQKCAEYVRSWRNQPRTQVIPKSGYALTGETLQVNGADFPDPLFAELDGDLILQDIQSQFIGGHSLVSLSGSFGSAKYTKACQFLKTKYVLDHFTPVPFSAHANQDIYSYLKRFTVAARAALDMPPLAAITDVVAELTTVLETPVPPKAKPLLLLISGVERFFDPPVRTGEDHRGEFRARNKVSNNFLKLLKRWANESGHESRILLTTRFNCRPLSEGAIIELRPQDSRSVFWHKQLGLPDETANRLEWELNDQPLALPIASAWITDRGASSGMLDPGQPESRMTALLKEVQSAPSERGTRVVHHVISQLDVGKEPLHYEMLRVLSSFSRPATEEVLAVAFEEVEDRLDRAEHEALSTPQRLVSGVRSGPNRSREGVVNNLKRFHLLERLEGAYSGPRFVVSPLVKRFCSVHRARRTPVEGRSFGLNGYGARGPFAEPGSDHSVLLRLFNRFCDHAEASLERGEMTLARRLVRFAFEIVRSNFCCNTVTRWGSYSDFLRMTTRCYDLIKFYGQHSKDQLWSPGVERTLTESEDACVTTEEIIWLLNEIALAFYSSGAIQDAIRVWGLAFDWREVVKVSDPQQATLYGASLHCHMGMAYIHIGQLSVAEEYFRAALDDAREADIDDLQIRLRGMLARVKNLRGDLPAADKEYGAVIEELQDKNLRAQCYYLRFHGLLKARMQDYKKAEALVTTSMNVAASQNHPDVREYARALLGRIYAEQKGNLLSSALREFDVAMRYAKEKEMRILETEAMLGMAGVQLELGDSSAALYRGFEALKIANDCILALRQVEAMTIIGRAFAAQGKTGPARDYLELARDLAQHCEYRLHERDISQVLLSLPARNS